MLRCLAIIVPFAVCAPVHADSKPVAKKGIEGYWLGTLKTGVVELRLGIKIETKDGKLVATVDSIDQGADIPDRNSRIRRRHTDAQVARHDAGNEVGLRWQAATRRRHYQGGNRAGAKLPLELKRQEKAFALNRPQHPKKPYPYVEEEVTFDSNAKDVKLAGTLTQAEG